MKYLWQCLYTKASFTASAVVQPNNPTRARPPAGVKTALTSRFMSAICICSDKPSSMKAFPHMSVNLCTLRDVCWRYTFYRRESMPSRSACIDVSVSAQPQKAAYSRSEPCDVRLLLTVNSYTILIRVIHDLDTGMLDRVSSWFRKGHPAYCNKEFRQVLAVRSPTLCSVFASCS